MEFRQFDIVQVMVRGVAKTGMVTVSAGTPSEASVAWFDTDEVRSAWWSRSELKVIGNAMDVVINKMAGQCGVRQSAYPSSGSLEGDE